MKDSAKAKRAPVSGRRKRYILIAMLGVSMLLLISIFALFAIDRSNTLRYRSENYEKLSKNLVEFSDVLSHTDGLLENMKTSSRVLPLVSAMTQEEIKNSLLPSDWTGGPYVAVNASPFENDSQEHLMFSRLLALNMGNPSISELVLYLPENGTYIALTLGGGTCVVCFTPEDFEQIIHIEGNPLDAEDYTLFAAQPTAYSQSELYVVRRLEGGQLLFCGLDNASWREALFANSVGRSYALKQMILQLPSGGRIYMEPERGTAGVPEALLAGQAAMLVDGKDTIMRLSSDSPGYELLALLRETGATGVLMGDTFRLFLLINALWLAVVIAVCLYVFVRISRPLHRLGNVVGAEGGEETMVDEIERIWGAIENYDIQLRDKQMTIRAQNVQLRQALLREMLLGQNTVPAKEQMEQLGLTHLLERYVVIALYPDDGRWSHEDGSAQASSYRQHITALSVMESIKAQLQNDSAEFVAFQACLLVIVPAQDQEQEADVCHQVEQCLMDVSHQLQKRFQVGLSKAHCGAQELSHAYHEAMKRAAIVQEQQSGRSEDVSLSSQLKQNMHMADLIYVEKYAGAFACFREMIHTLSGQKSARLRNQQISCLLSLTLCMLLETNGINASVIEQMDVDVTDLISLKDEEEIIARWGEVFGTLENHQDVRLCGRYSEQFASIYQYMRAHFRDSELSLSFLADEFNMSMSTLSREFQKNLGQGFLECLHGIRIEAARYEIEHTNAPLSDIAISVGYTNTLTMTRAFKKYLGCTPGVFRKKENDAQA